MGDPLASLSPADRAGLAGPVDELCHDLGKYVHFQARACGQVDEFTSEQLRQALVADLLFTRRGPEGSASAADIWASKKPNLRLLKGDPDYDAIVVAMAAIEAATPGLEAGECDAATLTQALAAAREVQRASRALRDRLRRS